MKIIKLTRGYEAMVDDEDFEELSKHSWHAMGVRHVYARSDSGAKTTLMHRFILKLAPGENCDHVNGDTLDNRRSNLRVATLSQNAMNRKRKSDCKSRFKGVRFRNRERYGRKSDWIARIQVNGKRSTVGAFSTEIAAAIAYDQAARKHFGAFVRLNFPYGAG